jgi:ATP-binding cassette subfamily F protein uup
VKSKRSFKEEREYTSLPERIAALEQEQKKLHAAIHDPAFYTQPTVEIHAALERVAAIDDELLATLARWDALDSIGKN